jgi:hypothetical protein
VEAGGVTTKGAFPVPPVAVKAALPDETARKSIKRLMERRLMVCVRVKNHPKIRFLPEKSRTFVVS